MLSDLDRFLIVLVITVLNLKCTIPLLLTLACDDVDWIIFRQKHFFFLNHRHDLGWQPNVSSLILFSTCCLILAIVTATLSLRLGIHVRDLFGLYLPDLICKPDLAKII